jgi:hypothetical protein
MARNCTVVPTTAEGVAGSTERLVRVVGGIIFPPLPPPAQEKVRSIEAVMAIRRITWILFKDGS